MPSYRHNAQIEAVVQARHSDPFGFLGMHKGSAGLYARAMLPGAEFDGGHRHRNRADRGAR